MGSCITAAAQTGAHVWRASAHTALGRRATYRRPASGKVSAHRMRPCGRPRKAVPRTSHRHSPACSCGRAVASFGAQLLGWSLVGVVWWGVGRWRGSTGVGARPRSCQGCDVVSRGASAGRVLRSVEATRTGRSHCSCVAKHSDGDVTKWGLRCRGRWHVRMRSCSQLLCKLLAPRLHYSLHPMVIDAPTWNAAQEKSL